MNKENEKDINKETKKRLSRNERKEEHNVRCGGADEEKLAELKTCLDTAFVCRSGHVVDSTIVMTSEER